MITKKQIQHAVGQYARGFKGNLLEDEYIEYVAHYSLYSIPEWMSVDDYVNPNEAEMIELVQGYYSIKFSRDEALELIDNDFAKSNFALRLFWEYDGGTIEHDVPESMDYTIKDMVDFIMDDYNEYQTRVKNDDFWRY